MVGKRWARADFACERRELCVERVGRSQAPRCLQKQSRPITLERVCFLLPQAIGLFDYTVDDRSMMCLWAQQPGKHRRQGLGQRAVDGQLDVGIRGSRDESDAWLEGRWRRPRQYLETMRAD